MKIKAQSFRLLNKGSFKVAHGSRTFTDTLIVSIEKDGCVGYGEASHVPYYGISVDDSIKLIEKLNKERVLSEHLTHEELHQHLVSSFGNNHFAICAVDMALWDLKAQLKGLTLMEFITQHAPHLQKVEKMPVSNFTIGLGTIEEMVEKVKASNFPSLKIKLGTPEDDKIIKSIRPHTQAVLRVDANTGWKLQDALYLTDVMIENEVEFIEQPFAREAFTEMEQLLTSTNAIFIADESCRYESDLEKCLGAFSGINIKLSKCGGITPALRMIHQARAYEMKVMIGCMTESSIGISALAQLLPFVDYADLDGALLIENDLARGVIIDEGVALFPERPGHGAQLSL